MILTPFGGRSVFDVCRSAQPVHVTMPHQDPHQVNPHQEGSGDAPGAVLMLLPVYGTHISDSPMCS
jgi:hypothetical protein